MSKLLKRRRFQFSLRTLFVAVAVLGIPLSWVGWQVRIVQRRKAVLERVEAEGGHYAIGTMEQADVSWFRYMLGDRPIAIITVDAKPDEIQRIRTIIPEAPVQTPESLWF